MKTTDINALELVRCIRDKHAEQLQGKSNKEIIEFFREAGRLSNRHGSKKYRPAAKKKARKRSGAAH